MSASSKLVPFEEMRRTRRIAVCFRAEFQGRHVRGSGMVQNISVSGALLEEADPLLLSGGEIVIRFPFFDDSLPVELRAQVVRETPGGFAVRFLGVDRRIHHLLTVAIAKAAVLDDKALPLGNALVSPQRGRFPR